MEGQLGLKSHCICWQRQLPDAYLPAILRLPGAWPWLHRAQSSSCPSQKVQAQLPRGFERERTSHVSTAPNIHPPASLFRVAKCPGKRLFLNSSASVGSAWGLQIGCLKENQLRGLTLKHRHSYTLFFPLPFFLFPGCNGEMMAGTLAATLRP